MSSTEEYVCRLTEQEKSFAAVNLNETDDNRSSTIAEIRQWIQDNNKLLAPTDDFSILRFLRACKFNVDKTKRKLGNYYKQRTALPEWYENRDPRLPVLQELFDIGVFLPLKELDNEGKMVVIIRAAIHDPSKHKLSDVLKVGLMILDLATRDHESVTLHGIKAIFDLRGVSYSHVLQLPPRVIKNLVHAWQGCYPLRIHSMDFINAPRLVNVVLNVFRGFMTPKLRRRIHVHSGGSETFHKIVTSSILPTEYGGTCGALEDLIQHWKRAAEENQEWYVEQEKYKLI